MLVPSDWPKFLNSLLRLLLGLQADQRYPVTVRNKVCCALDLVLCAHSHSSQWGGLTPCLLATRLEFDDAGVLVKTSMSFMPLPSPAQLVAFEKDDSID